MKIEKIKAVKNDFAEGCGPSETVTLGFKVGDDSYILGTYYFGPGMEQNMVAGHNRLERFIDSVVKGNNPQSDEYIDILKAVTDHAAINTCLHEETYRGGSIWEICSQCGMKWADDEGGKPADAHELAKPIQRAYDLLDKLR